MKIDDAQKRYSKDHTSTMVHQIIDNKAYFRKLTNFTARAADCVLERAYKKKN